MASTDAELVAAARSGDRAAFARLLERHRAVVLAACGRLLRDDALAEDAAQEAAVTAYLQLDRLRAPARFGAWLVGIGLNVGRRWLRARMRAHGPGHDAARGDTLPTLDPGPDEVVEARELAARVRRAVASLPAGQREAVVGYYLLGLPQREVAALLGTSPGAVKSRLHKARDTLAGALAATDAAGSAPDGAHNQVTRRRDGAMTRAGTRPVAMRVSDVCRLGDGAARYAAILEEEDGDRALPIWVGEPEATALAAALEEADLPRPMTHWLTAALLDAAGVDLRGVRVTRLAEGVFYATVEVEGPPGRVEVDARPSDALTLAVLAGVPVTVEAAVVAAVEAQARQRGTGAARQLRAEAAQHASAIVTAALARIEHDVAEAGEDDPAR